MAPSTSTLDPNPANVGMPVTAYDPNGDDENLTYTLSGNDAGSFDIDPVRPARSARR